VSEEAPVREPAVADEAAATSRSDYLDAALRIGREVAASAIWSGARCSWIGAMPEEASGSLVLNYLAFGPDLYAGTAGVGLVLAELWDACEGDEPELRRVSLGAFEHALSRAEEASGPGRLGFYGGRPGIALCLARGGAVLGEPRLVERAGELVEGLDYGAEPLENDLIGGRAGGVVALLALRRLGVEAATAERAIGVGQDLVAAAERGPEGWSWPSGAAVGPRNLTGLSHGAAGIGLALLELWRETEAGAFAVAAEAAFAYERSLYDPRARNWPDLRESAATGATAGAPPPCATLWCHGAPGIALSRLRAGELDAGGDWESEARLALETTAASVRAQVGRGNYSLCHGLAGNVEILVEGAALLDDDAAELARAVADDGIERYLEGGAPWPLGVLDGQSPALFLGLAGTAYWYLRLHDPGRPSLLLPRPESFAWDRGDARSAQPKVKT
jgi:lantibiotic modifying enzyme